MVSVSGIPLDQKKMTDGSSDRLLPALHSRWSSRCRFVAYVAPPADSSDQGLMGEWAERLQYISTDLHWLLQLPHQQFWCQVIFDESLHHMLDSFLQYSPRPYDMDNELTGHNRSLHDQVTRLVFFTYLRMATYKESKENWLTPQVFAEIIYENFLFDIPKLFDLCALYGHANAALLAKMVTNVFMQQPQYVDDLRTAVPTIIQVLVNIAIKCGLEVEPAGLTPQKLNSGHNHPVDMVTMEIGELMEVMSYLADTAITLTSFLSVYPPASKVLHELQFCPHLAHMYEKLIPGFQSAIKQRQFDSVRQKKILRNKLCQARVHLLTTFHLIVSHTCLQPVLDAISSRQDNSSSKCAEVNQHIEDFLTVMSAVLGEKRFLADYEGQFSFQDDLDILSQAAGDVDEAHYRYILEAINVAFAAHGQRKKPKGNMNTGGRTSPDGSPCPPSALSSAPSLAPLQAPSKSGSTQQGAEMTVVSGVELDSLVCAVKDLLPHLGHGFIQLALEELDYDVESVVSAVLEDKLPVKLRQVHSSLDSVPAVPEGPAPQLLMVESRRNIYDNDEFDVFNNPMVDVKHIHKGKRTDHELESVLEDKEGIRDLKSLYDAYGSMDVSSMYDPQMYDDEYDDTYDINNVGADDADSADELTQIRPFTVPQVLQRRPARAQQSNGSSDEGETPRDQFVQDPSKLRERQEQKRAARNQGPPAHDVKGKVKGQGQTEEVLRNRRFKEKNKGVRGNHNRRAMADKKQSKGMF